MNQDTTLQQEASVREARFKRRQLLRVFDTRTGVRLFPFWKPVSRLICPFFKEVRGITILWTP